MEDEHYLVRFVIQTQVGNLQRWESGDKSCSFLPGMGSQREGHRYKGKFMSRFLAERKKEPESFPFNTVRLTASRDG